MRALCAGLLAAAAATIGLAPSASANLLVNPGFEDPSTAPGVEYPGAGNGWTSFNAVYTVSSAVVAPHSGNQSLKTFGGGANGAFQDFAASPGQAWDGSVWMLNSSVDPMANGQVAAINIEWRDAGLNLISFETNGSFTASSPMDVWTLQPVSGIAPAGTAYARLVILTGDFLPGGPGGAPFFDDASFDLVPTPGACTLLGLGGLAAVRRRRR